MYNTTSQATHVSPETDGNQPPIDTLRQIQRQFDEVLRFLGNLGNQPAAEMGATSLANDAKSTREIDRLLPNVAQQARLQQSHRIARSNYIDGVLGSEVAWDLLLEATIAKIENRRTSITSLTAMTQSPTTTALRWLNVLVERGLLVKTPSMLDHRVVYAEIPDLVFQDIARLILGQKVQSTKSAGPQFSSGLTANHSD